ncbi:MAG: magnesium transporter CorA family protein [Eubacteriales bacterium]|nr:magnesium transporter CorA family protein [Eubacteriales bacterium]
MRKIFKTVDDQMIELNTLEKGSWVHLQNPTKEEIDGLNTRFALEPSYLRAVLDEEESARIERSGNQTLIVVDVPYVEVVGESYSYSTFPIGIVLVDDVIITITTKDTPIFTDFIEERIRDFWTFKRTRFILQLLHRNSARFLSFLKQIDKASMFVQDKLQSSMRNKELMQMMELEKSLVYFSTSLRGNELVLEKMMRLEMLNQYPEDTNLLEDVIIENKQAIEMCAIYRDIMNGAMDAFASIISNNQNTVMKLLTSITIIISIPTLIASIWGMNIDLPLTNNPNAFTILIGTAVILSAICTIIMWKKRMF